MLYRGFRRRPLRFALSGNKAPLARKIVMSLILISLFLFVSTWILLLQIRPTVVLLAKSKVTDLVLQDVNQAVADEIERGGMTYDKLVTLEKDGNGNVTALVTNMPLINTLQAKLTQSVANRVRNEISTKIGIPVGSAVGGLLFSDRGPSVPVRIMSVTNLHTKFTNSFSGGGDQSDTA